jgi:hypothetical protein
MKTHSHTHAVLEALKTRSGLAVTLTMHSTLPRQWFRVSEQTYRQNHQLRTGERTTATQPTWTVRPRNPQRPISFTHAAITHTHERAGCSLPHMVGHWFMGELHYLTHGPKIKKAKFKHLRFPYTFAVHDIGTRPHVHMIIAVQMRQLESVRECVPTAVTNTRWLAPHHDVTVLQSAEDWIRYMDDSKKSSAGLFPMWC